eukprot:418562-Prymnesium_polylepis.1
MAASGMFRGCYATEFENDVCVCYRSTGQRTRTGHACGDAQTTQTVPHAIVYFSRQCVCTQGAQATC